MKKEMKQVIEISGRGTNIYNYTRTNGGEWVKQGMTPWKKVENVETFRNERAAIFENLGWTINPFENENSFIAWKEF